MSVSANITKFLEGMARSHAKAQAAALKAVNRFGEKVLGDAQQLAPIDTGDLRDSGTPEPAVLEGEGVTKRIGFTVEYAVFVHENLTAKHTEGEAKFLEKAIVANKPQFDAYVAGQVKAALEGGG